MPGILKYTPPWLSRPSPGFDLFSCNPSTTLSIDANRTSGPRRTIAHRGTEVFVAVGNELRWSDLILLRDTWEAQTNLNEAETVQQNGYRILKVPVAGKITQLVVSPTGCYLAIVTSHTIHVAILPDSSHLTTEDSSPIKLKTYHVGSTAHVLEQSPVASVLWHPLGVHGSCLVSVTVDAVARLWELDRDNKWSFDSPALAVDLKKLANAASASEDLSPSKYGTSKGFSPDSFEMEVASACFGGLGQESENSWAAMTLWVAMREGDIYALCPFLPNKWESLPSHLEGFGALIACRSSATEDADLVSRQAQRNSNHQNMWVSDLTSQQVSLGDAAEGHQSYYVLQRPLRPGPIPMLQGPLHITPDADQLFDITDICAFTSIEDDGSDSGEDFGASNGDEPTSTALICVATSDGKVHVCIDIDGVEARWLPSKKITRLKEDDTKSSELLLIETVTVSGSNPNCWPVFSRGPQSQESFFVTHDQGVSYIDVSAWTKKLAEELIGESDSGVPFRMDLLVESTDTSLEHPIRLPHNSLTYGEDHQSPDCVACISVLDSDLGFFVLSTIGGQPYSATLEEPLELEHDLTDDESEDHHADAVRGLLQYESRPTYQPPQELWSETQLNKLIDQHVHSHARRTMKEEVKLSPTTLKLLMEAHRVLSHETHRLGLAAASLFRRCERLQEEFREQVRQAKEAADRIDAVLDDDGDLYDEEDDHVGTARKIDQRLDAVRSRQEDLTARYSELRRKLSRLSGRPLTEKENAWGGEIRMLNSNLGSSGTNVSNGDGPNGQSQTWQRVEDFKNLAAHLLAESLQTDFTTSDPRSTTTTNVLPSNMRARSDIHALLERQTALVAATGEKLEGLSLMSA